MKGMAKTILLGGFILATQAAMADGSAFPGEADDAGVRLSPRVTYQSEHANDGVTTAGSAFPGSAPSWYTLAPRDTYAREHANDRVTTAGSAFPGASDDAGIYLPAHNTYADSHLGNPVARSQPTPGIPASAD